MKLPVEWIFMNINGIRAYQGLSLAWPFVSERWNLSTSVIDWFTKACAMFYHVYMKVHIAVAFAQEELYPRKGFFIYIQI